MSADQMSLQRTFKVNVRTYFIFVRMKKVVRNLFPIYKQKVDQYSR